MKQQLRHINHQEKKQRFERVKDAKELDRNWERKS